LLADELQIIESAGAARGNKNRNAVFTPPAFHPKALRLRICTWQVFWLVSCLLPSHPTRGGTVAKCKPFAYRAGRYAWNSQLRG